jgi:hypothetical protein
MAQEVDLTTAVQTLKDVYGESFQGDFDGGKDAMTNTLIQQLKIDHGEAKKLVEALVEAHTIRYEGGPLGIPSAENSSVNPPVGFFSEGTWYL